MHQLKCAFVAICGAIAVGVVAGSSAGAQAQGQVVVASWGGTYQDALREAIFKPFEKATGIKLIEATGPTMPKLRAMLDAGSPEWDVVDMDPAGYPQLSSSGMLQQIDYAAMDQSIFADFPQDVVQPFGVGTGAYAQVIGFNTKKYTQANGPKSWADVWDVKKFPGPRVLPAGNGIFPPIEYALLADGVPPEKLYPLDLKRAYSGLSRIKPSVLKWTTGAAEPSEALISGEAVIGPVSQGRIQLAKERGAPVDYVWDQALTEHSWWVILRGSKNINNAQKFIEFASRPESQAAMAKLFPIGPLNRKALDLIPAERAKLLPTYPQNWATTIGKNNAWWGQKDPSGKTNLEINNATWNAWILQQKD